MGAYDPSTIQTIIQFVYQVDIPPFRYLLGSCTHCYCFMTILYTKLATIHILYRQNNLIVELEIVPSFYNYRDQYNETVIFFMCFDWLVFTF